VLSTFREPLPMRSNTTPDGAGIRVGSILHKYANAQSILASKQIMAGSKHIEIHGSDRPPHRRPVSKSGTPFPAARPKQAAEDEQEREL